MTDRPDIAINAPAPLVSGSVGINRADGIPKVEGETVAPIQVQMPNVACFTVNNPDDLPFPLHTAHAVEITGHDGKVYTFLAVPQLTRPV